MEEESQKLRKILQEKPNFKEIKFPFKIRDIQKIEKKNFIAISVFSYVNNEKYTIYASNKCYEEKQKYRKNIKTSH